MIGLSLLNSTLRATLSLIWWLQFLLTLLSTVTAAVAVEAPVCSGFSDSSEY